jgi:NADPH-dependent 2,4-dienoyl-CoA reductase/sulfur reductase-like enzyme
VARSEVADVAIIGGGPSGLAAAAEAKGAGAARVIMIERYERVGGILNQQVHDGFGTEVFKEAFTGPEYSAIYEDRVNERGVETWLKTTVTSLTKDRVLTVRSEKGILSTTRSIRLSREFSRAETCSRCTTLSTTPPWNRKRPVLLPQPGP